MKRNINKIGEITVLNLLCVVGTCFIPFERFDSVLCAVDQNLYNNREKIFRYNSLHYNCLSGV